MTLPEPLRPAFRGRIFLLWLGMLALVALVYGLVAVPALQEWHRAARATEARRVAAAVAGALPQQGPWPGPDAVAALSASSGLSVSLVPAASLDTAPAVARLAMTRGVAVDTEGAVPVAAARAGVRGVVLVRARPDDTGGLRTRMTLGLAIGLAVAAALAWLMAHLFSRAFKGSVSRLQEQVSRRAPGEVAVNDRELTPLADSVTELTGELRQALRHLEGERERLLAVLEGMDDAVIATDDDGVVTLANSAARGLLGGDDSPVGRALIDLIRAPKLHALVDRVCAGLHDMTELDLPGPPERHLMARAAPQRAGGAVIVLQDMTRVRQLEQMRREFVANVSHELRTPVSVIRANAETLMEGAIDEPEFARGFLEALLRNADRLSLLVADLLDLARVESGRFPIERRRMSPAVAVGAVADALGATIADQRLDLQIDVEPRLESYADPKALEQVLVNLVHNAIKHSPEGGTIRVVATADDTEVHIAVEDDGPGVPVEARERIFERFYRVDAGRSREVGGTGLGLAIARSLVDAMGGGVGVGESPSGGARFWLTLPRFQSVFEAEPESRVRVQAARSAGDSADGWDPRVQELRRRVLIMAGRVEEMIAHAVRAVVRRDVELARRTIIADRNVNRDEIETDELCLSLLESGSVNDADLRFITRASKMVTDLERIADLAVNICERVERLEGTPRLSQRDAIPRMAVIVQSMVRDVIDAFVGRDAHRAQQVIERDDEVDELFHQLSRKVVALMSQDAELVEAGIHLQAVAKFLERMADHATNLAEQVVFMVRGDEIRHPGKLVAPKRVEVPPPA